MNRNIALAFYDFDGTLVSSNVLTQYIWYRRRDPCLATNLKLARLAALAPVLGAIEMCSRTLFNEVFYREYRGLREDWLRREAEGLFEQVFRRRIFPGARSLLLADRDAGFRPVLVTGSPDFAVGPVARHFGFEDVIANTLEFENGVATGAIRPPILAAA
ncbi:MAG: HAD family hydrolase, partial [Bryobacteraceae bacterium]